MLLLPSRTKNSKIVVIAAKGIHSIEQYIKGLEAQAQNLKERIELSNQYRLNIDNLKEACALVADNINSLSFEQKRFALEVLQVRVMIDGDNIALHGAVPIEELSIVSTQSCRTGKYYGGSTAGKGDGCGKHLCLGRPEGHGIH